MLEDGSSLAIRSIEPTDADALVAFHSGLSLESTRLRFFSPHPTLTDREIERFTNVDHDRREALVALDGDQIVAVARYDRMPDAGTAEVAFVVAEDWRRRGVATRLLHRLAELATERGMTRLVADTLCENRPMAAVFQHAGFVERHTIDQGVVHYTMELGSPA